MSITRLATDPISDAAARTAHEAERNWLLAALTLDEYAVLLPYFEVVNLAREQRLGPPHEAIPYVYFPQSGVVSIIKRMADGIEVEVGTVGYEGMTALGESGDRSAG
jgi:hypothetical protein